jgi:hypothetical protein
MSVEAWICGGCGHAFGGDEGERCGACGMLGCVDCMERLGRCWYCGDFLGVVAGDAGETSEGRGDEVVLS